MIPDFLWDGENWIVRYISSAIEILSELKYCDGSVRNIIFNVKDIKDLDNAINQTFNKYDWINKILIMQGDEIIRVFQVNSENNKK